MNDVIRIDPHEIAELSRNLNRLSAEVEELCGELRLAQHRLSPGAECAVGEGLQRWRRRFVELADRSEAAAQNVMRSADDFSACERAVSRRMKEQSDAIADVFIPTACEKRREE